MFRKNKDKGKNKKENTDSDEENSDDEEEVIVEDDEDESDESSKNVTKPPTEKQENKSGENKQENPPKEGDAKTNDNKSSETTKPNAPLLPKEIKIQEKDQIKEAEANVEKLKRRNMKPPTHHQKKSKEEDEKEEQDEDENEEEPPKNNERVKPLVNNDESELDDIRNSILEDEVEEQVEQREEEFEREDEKIVIQLTDGKYEVNPKTDTIFSLICMKCFRYTENQSLVQSLNLKKMLEQYGCVCKEQSGFEISITQVILNQAKALGIKAKPFENKFIDYLFRKFGFTRLVGIIQPKKVAEKEQAPPKKSSQPP